jgi:hypothetical protein
VQRRLLDTLDVIGAYLCEAREANVKNPLIVRGAISDAMTEIERLRSLAKIELEQLLARGERELRQERKQREALAAEVQRLKERLGESATITPLRRERDAG